MTVQDFGIEQLGSYLRGLSPTALGSTAFGLGSSAFTGSNTFLEDETIRVPILWSVIGNSIRAQSTLSITDSNGSYLAELGLVHGSASNGSDIFSADNSAIGSKNETFSVLIDQKITIKRVV